MYSHTHLFCALSQEQEPAWRDWQTAGGGAVYASFKYCISTFLIENLEDFVFLRICTCIEQDKSNFNKLERGTCHRQKQFQF